jgi:hypothetical protein
MNYDNWLTSDRDFDRFHGHRVKQVDAPDWIEELKKEIMEEKKRERNI